VRASSLPSISTLEINLFCVSKHLKRRSPKNKCRVRTFYF
jgi:hypothetical protein